MSFAELRNYDERLYRKPRWLVFNKADLMPPDEAERGARAIVRRLRWKRPWFIASALTGKGCREVCQVVMRRLEGGR